MPNLSFNFEWFRDPKGYQLIPAPAPRFKLQSLGKTIDAWDTLEDDRVARIVRNGGKLERYQPLEIKTLFERFAKIRKEADVLKFVETFGPLTREGLLRGKGDIVHKIIADAEHMCGGASKHLASLIVDIDPSRGETRLKVTPVCLLDAIWLQYAQSGARSHQCPQCDKRFLVGAGTGRRRIAEYCSDECRVKYNSLKRSLR
jgi:hypothetical protein